MAPTEEPTNELAPAEVPTEEAAPTEEPTKELAPVEVSMKEEAPTEEPTKETAPAEASMEEAAPMEEPDEELATQWSWPAGQLKSQMFPLCSTRRKKRGRYRIVTFLAGQRC